MDSSNATIRIVLKTEAQRNLGGGFWQHNYKVYKIVKIFKLKNFTANIVLHKSRKKEKSINIETFFKVKFRAFSFMKIFPSLLLFLILYRNE